MPAYGGDMNLPTGSQPGAGQIMPADREGWGQNANSSMAAVAQLFARLSQEIEESKPKNCVHFIVDFLCKHYPEHLHGFASIWQMDPDLERERHEVVNFFKSHKISTAVAAHFTNAGYDTLDTLTTLSPDALVDVEAFNNVKWLPGHKVRLQQIFSEISARVRAYRQAHPNQTAQVVGAYASPQGGDYPRGEYGRPQYGRTGPPAIGPPPSGGPPAIKEYIANVSPPVRVDGLGGKGFAGAGGQLALAGHAGPPGPTSIAYPAVNQHYPGGGPGHHGSGNHSPSRPYPPARQGNHGNHSGWGGVF